MNKRLVLRVASSTDVNDLASKILYEIAETGMASCTGVGAGPINQIVKAVARARQKLTEGDLCMIPSFVQETTQGVCHAWIRVHIDVIRVAKAMIQ